MSTSDGYFSGSIAEAYDADHAGTNADQAVEVLVELAGSGPALEFAIGTGRVALPLVKKGVEVSGIELSTAMVSKLQDKPGGAEIDVVIGDVATVQIPRAFSLVYLVFNTINNLNTQAAQIACFANAAHHLSDGGFFVVEVQVPPIQRLNEGERLLAFDRSANHFGTDEIDVVTQSFTSHHLWLKETGPEQLSIPMRYVWPSELDLMARLAGMKLDHRWGDWSKSRFDARSRSHVSVWQKLS